MNALLTLTISIIIAILNLKTKKYKKLLVFQSPIKDDC